MKKVNKNQMLWGAPAGHEALSRGLVHLRLGPVLRFSN